MPSREALLINGFLNLVLSLPAVNLNGKWTPTNGCPVTSGVADMPKADTCISVARSSRPDLCVSPRQDSASDRLGHRSSGGLDRGSGNLNIDRSPRQDLNNSRPSSSSWFEPDTNASPRLATGTHSADSADQASNPFQNNSADGHWAASSGECRQRDALLMNASIVIRQYKHRLLPLRRPKTSQKARVARENQ